MKPVARRAVTSQARHPRSEQREGRVGLGRLAKRVRGRVQRIALEVSGPDARRGPLRS